MFTKTTVNRWLFILVSLFIITLILWNTFLLFNQLKENERTKMQIWASAQEEFKKDDLGGANIEMILAIIQGNTTTPMVSYTYKENTYDSRNIEVLPQDSLKRRNKLKKMAAQFKTEYVPIDIADQGTVLETVYYGNSPLINRLKYYPAILILILFLCFAVLYFFYKTSKNAEQNKLWAGMAKETAHQIGTPLSSLVGWTEILKTENVDPDYVVEMEKDIDRLKTITERFSKVGSVPTLEKVDIVAETKEAYDYLKTRSSKLIEFEISTPEEKIEVNLNSQLYGWVIENLVKNGIDAMRGKGSIFVGIIPKGRNVLIQVSDTGKGIPKKRQKQVFAPGFTTKKRGWGLGLSLAKRIIEEYHNGKIHVLKSTLKKGTTIEIALKRQD